MGARILNNKKNASIHNQSNPYGSSGLIKVFWSEVMHFCKKNIHI